MGKQEINVQGIVDQSNLLRLAETAGAVLADKGRGLWRSNCPLHNGHDPSGFSIIEGHDGKLCWTCFSGD